MRHLSPQEFVDLAEGAGSESARRHAASCESCQRQAAELEGVMRAVAAVDVPEPSPLFWNHLSMRVRAAVASAPPPRAWWVPALPERRTIQWSAALAGVALVALLSARALAPHAPLVSMPPAAPASAVVREPNRDALTEDASFSVVAELASDIDMDTAVAAGLAPAGSVDRAISDLSGTELLELQRLLDEEIARVDRS
jgi:hypothetical protein